MDMMALSSSPNPVALDLWHIALLALVQGLSEFLPISSSGHLQLLHVFGGWPPHSPTLDVAVHFGTLTAVIMYLRRLLRHLIRGFRDGMQRELTPAARDVALVICASLPVLIVAAMLVGLGWYAPLRHAQIVAWATIIFALPLYFADRFAPQLRSWTQSSWSTAWLIGLAQCFALLPGASRAGVTITAARAFGMSRQQAIEFSLILSIPVISGLTLGTLVTLWLAQEPLAWQQAGLAFALSASIALASLHIFVRLMAYLSFLPFVLYRLGLGIMLLYLL